MISKITLDQDGYALIDDAITEAEVAAVLNHLGTLALAGAGTRNLLDLPWCQALAHQLRAYLALLSVLPLQSIAVQCTYFDKNPDRNWLVSPHQDLAIPVKAKIPHPDLSGWSEKEGQVFVQAPEPLLKQLLAVRLHLDACGPENGPLRVVPGSHRQGRLSDAQIKTLRASSHEITCCLQAGGILLMRPLLIHASSKAVVPTHRRVMHFLFGPMSPGYGLQWQYAV